MKIYVSIICLMLFYGCMNAPKNPINEEEINAAAAIKKQKRSLFTPKTFYYTSHLEESNPAWTAKQYSIFQLKILDSVNHHHFELLDVYGNDDNIVVFNEVIYEGKQIKHLILDTLYNYSDFAKDVPDKGSSVGVLDKEELDGLDINTIEKNSIIAVVKTSGPNTYKADMDSAIARHKKAGKNLFEAIDVKRKISVLKAWFANTKTKRIEQLQN